jgi:uncharacterized protein YkwD
MSPTQFDRRADAKQEIRFDALQTNLLNAAVLHETNRRRAGQKLRPLKTHPKAVQVAFIQSHIMAKRGSISHDNPENPKFETLTKRIRSVGVNPGLAAENVATAFGLRYDSGKAFYKRKQRERTTFSYTPNGRAILPHTYESFAKSLVDAWMNSPGHRRNILLADAEFLGVSCIASFAKSEMPIFYCTQVFLAPIRSRRG